MPSSFIQFSFMNQPFLLKFCYFPRIVFPASVTVHQHKLHTGEEKNNNSRVKGLWCLTVPPVLLQRVSRQVDGVALASTLWELQIRQISICAHPRHLQLCKQTEQTHTKLMNWDTTLSTVTLCCFYWNCRFYCESWCSSHQTFDLVIWNMKNGIFMCHKHF